MLQFNISHFKYRILLVNSRRLCSSCPQITASGCSANNHKCCGLYLTFQPNTLNSVEQLYCVRIYLKNVPFHRDMLHRSISAMCYIYHCSYGIHDAYILTSSTSNFIFAVVMKVQVKPSVFASKFQLFDIGCLLHLKHKYSMAPLFRYSTMV